MADNVNVTAGAGTTIATDQCGTDHYQRIKLTDGTADSTTPVNVDIGVKANALRVVPADDITDATYIGDIKFGEAEPNSAAILVDTTAIKTAIQLLDNAIDGNYLNVNTNIAGTDIVGGAGVVAAGVQRITLASDDPGVALLTTIDADTGAMVTDLAAIEVLLGTIDTDTGAMAVDLAALEVDLAAIEVLQTTIAGDTTSIDGKITACNTGAVVVASGAITETNSASLAVVGGGTEATALRVTLANDSTGVITVDASNLDIRDLSSASDSILAICAGAVAHDSEDAGSPIKIGAKAVNMDGTEPGTAVAEGDRANNICDTYGRLLCDMAHPNFWTTNTLTYTEAQTNTSLKAAPGAGLSLYITDIIISNGATAGIITILDGSGGTEKAGGYFAVNGGMVCSFKTPIKLTADTALCLTSTSVTTHRVTINGYIAP